MSGRFVRASKYRHVHGAPARKTECYTNLMRPLSIGLSQNIAGNDKWLAVALQGGGGPLLIWDRSVVGRLPNDPPKLNVHKAQVIDFEFSPFLNNMIATASEDCTAKISIIPDDGKVNEVSEAAATLEGHSKKPSFIHFHPVANNVVATASYDNSIKVWDIEKQKDVLTYSAFEDLIHCFQWNRNGSLIGSTCKDKKVRLYDPRSTEKVVEAPGFEGAKQDGLAFADNCGFVITVGFSKTSMRQYSLWDLKKMDSPMQTKDIDQSAGVITPYYDPDNSILYLAGKGDGVIRYFEVNDESPNVHYLSDFRDTVSHKAVAFLPKSACDYSSCEIAIALRLMKDFIEPVSFQVPRKSELFQEDIYPDTYAGVPALTADEWFAGGNKDPPTRPIREQKKEQSVTFKAQKSATELARELDAANKKIADLEAEIKSLKEQLGKK